jgi:hypothetical protein
VISALLLAGVLDPNCFPRHQSHAHAVLPGGYHYHAHWYHAPPQPICRDPWPADQLEDIPLHEPPHSPVSAPPGGGDLGRVPFVIWPGYLPNPASKQPPATGAVHQPRGAVTPTAQVNPTEIVSVPEPQPLGLLVLGLAALGVSARRRGAIQGLPAPPRVSGRLPSPLTPPCST